MGSEEHRLFIASVSEIPSSSEGLTERRSSSVDALHFAQLNKVPMQPLNKCLYNICYRISLSFSISLSLALSVVLSLCVSLSFGLSLSLPLYVCLSVSFSFTQT